MNTEHRVSLDKKRMLAVLQPGDTVLTPKLDRMFRSARDALSVCDQLKANRISLHMIDLGGDTTTNGVSKLLFTILAAVAEAERDRTRERIRDVKADQRARHRYLGGSTPFGWKVSQDGGLIEEPAQQAAIVTIIALHRAGHGLRAIAAAMKAQRHEVSHVTVQKILRRAMAG